MRGAANENDGFGKGLMPGFLMARPPRPLARFGTPARCWHDRPEMLARIWHPPVSRPQKLPKKGPILEKDG